MAAEVGEIFKPGEKVLQSGIYLVTHDKEHADAHEVVCVNGKTFPPCNGCGSHPRFKLVRKAKHIEQSEHFN